VDKLTDAVKESAMAAPDPYQKIAGDDALPRLLARLAALQGIAVPLHRFAYQEQTSEGVEISRLPLPERSMELWQTRFAEATIVELSVESIHKSHLPLLWFSVDG
jgi:hypothetical protein